MLTGRQYDGPAGGGERYMTRTRGKYLVLLLIAIASLLIAQDNKPKPKPGSKSKNSVITDATINIEKCAGGDAEANGTFTFVAVDHEYNVVVYNPAAVFTDCPDHFFQLTTGQKKVCTANSGGIQPGDHRKSGYVVLPPGGIKDCPKGVRKTTIKGRGNPGDPNDITVP
jgi:hypothetical protein